MVSEKGASQCKLSTGVKSGCRTIKLKAISIIVQFWVEGVDSIYSASAFRIGGVSGSFQCIFDGNMP